MYLLEVSIQFLEELEDLRCLTRFQCADCHACIGQHPCADLNVFGFQHGEMDRARDAQDLHPSKLLLSIDNFDNLPWYAKTHVSSPSYRCVRRQSSSSLSACRGHVERAFLTGDLDSTDRAGILMTDLQRDVTAARAGNLFGWLAAFEAIQAREALERCRYPGNGQRGSLCRRTRCERLEVLVCSLLGDMPGSSQHQ